jgi:hypothetical protein
MIKQTLTGKEVCLHREPVCIRALLDLPKQNDSKITDCRFEDKRIFESLNLPIFESNLYGGKICVEYY